MSKFSQRMRQLRIENGISQDELSKKMNVSRSAIGNYEQGTREPSYEFLEMLADYFNVDMEYLIGKKDIKNKLKHYTALNLSDEEINVVYLYRNSDELQKEMVRRLLGYMERIMSYEDRKEREFLQGEEDS